MKNKRNLNKLDIVYVSFNEAPLIVEIISQIQSDGYFPKLFMDDRTDRDELNFLDEHNLTYELVHNPLTYVEGLYEVICKNLQAEWVLILTGDEYPTPQFLKKIEKRLKNPNPNIVAYGFVRRWVFRESNGKYVFSRAKFMGKDRQWRIVRHRSVDFHARIHTPGFDIPKGMKGKKLGWRTGVIHFDWVVHSLELRLKKLEFYGTQMSNVKDRFQKWYLPEQNVGEYRFVPLKDVDLISLSERLNLLQENKGWIGTTDE